MLSAWLTEFENDGPGNSHYAPEGTMNDGNVPSRVCVTIMLSVHLFGLGLYAESEAIRNIVVGRKKI